MTGEKAAVMKRQQALLAERYDLANRAAKASTMSRGKPVQAGVRAQLPKGDDLGRAGGDDPRGDRRRRTCSPPASCRCRTRITPKAACCFPKFHIDEIKKQEGRDLTRFDLDFDLPDHFLPEFPPPIFLTTRPDLGDVSQGKLVTIENFFELFNGILNPKQLEGLRLLVTPFPQQQFNPTDDRRIGAAEPRRDLLRLPRQRPHQRRDAPGRRHPAAGVPPPHRHAQRCAA